MHQVLAVKNGNAREVLEGAVDRIVVIANATNTGVGVKAGNNGIVKDLGALTGAAG